MNTCLYLCVSEFFLRMRNALATFVEEINTHGGLSEAQCILATRFSGETSPLCLIINRTYVIAHCNTADILNIYQVMHIYI
jgi:hypothetical protein